MRKNALKAKWAASENAVNGWLHIPSGWSAEVMAHAGYDSLTVDMQHGQLDMGDAMMMMRAVSTTDTMPMARVPWNEPGTIMRLLDAGAYGIICPMVDTREQCEQFVGACRYAPEGYRSRGPTRASIYGGADYVLHANEEIVTLAMIETAEAMQNLDAIASVPGLDGLYVGPGDLSLSTFGMDRSGIDLDYPEFLELLGRILAAATANNLIAGIHTNSPAYARRMYGMGFRLVTVMTDTVLMRTMAQQTLAELRGENQETEQKEAY